MNFVQPNVHFQIRLASFLIAVSCFHESTMRYCQDFLEEGTPDFEIVLSKEDLEKEVQDAVDGHLYVNEEISALYRKIADVLIEKDIVVFHSSAVEIDGNGYLIAARSGTGKSTHAHLLQEYVGKDFHYINDDKPLLKMEENGFLVYSTPWNGKERRGENIVAPLKAILFLSRGEEAACERVIDVKNIYFRLLSQVYLPYDKRKREKALKIADALCKRIAFYEITATLDIKSAQKTYERLKKYETE